MISAREAQKIILEQARPIGKETASLGSALGRFFSEPITAPIDLPPFDNAAMDGFAVRSGDTQQASKASPVSLEVIGTIAAGDPLTRSLFPGMQGPSPESGEGNGDHGNPLRVRAFRIMTGAPIPAGADAVIPLEETVLRNNACLMTQSVDPGKNLRKTGEDVRKGATVVEAGEKITSRTVALLAALGMEKVGVTRKPTVKIISTGNELVDVGAGSSRPGAGTAPLQPGKIYNSNGPALAAALEEIGIHPEAVLVTPDREDSLRQSLREGLNSDILITIGGVSAGDFDFVPEILQELQAKILFHRVAIKPGKPFLFAIRREEGQSYTQLIFGLPGNPVSALMVFDRFVRPALLKIAGSKNLFRGRKTAEAGEELIGSQGKEDYLRGIAEYREGRYVVRSAGGQGSNQLLPLARSNAILILPEGRKKVGAGESVEFEMFSEEP